MKDLEAGVTAAEGYTVAEAVSDFLDQGMKGKSPETISNYRSLAGHRLIPYPGAARLKKLTADELDSWMDGRAEELSGRTLRLIHQILERIIRHAQARDKVRRNVASLILVPEGQEGRPSKAITLDQAIQLLDQAGPGSEPRLAAYVVVSLLAGVRTEEARALTRAEVGVDAGTEAVYRSVRAKGDTKTRKILHGSMLDRREVAALCAARSCAWVAAASSCAAGVAVWSAPMPPWPEGPKSGTRRPAHDRPRGLTAARRSGWNCAALELA